MSALTVVVPPGDLNRGLGLAGASASGVAVQGAANATNSYGIAGGNLSHVQVSLPADGTGVIATQGPAPVIQDSTIMAGTGVADSATIRRSRIVANVDILATGDFYPTFIVDSSILQTEAGPSTETAVSAPETGNWPFPINQAAKVLLRHDTLLGDGAAGSTGIDCASAGVQGGTFGTCAVEVGSSIIQGFAHAMSAQPTARTRTPTPTCTSTTRISIRRPTSAPTSRLPTRVSRRGRSTSARST